MAAKATTKRGLLPGYFESLQQKESKERYLEKLKSIEGQDPYEIPRKEWIDDVDCRPDVTYINVGMYLFFTLGECWYLDSRTKQSNWFLNVKAPVC